MTRKHRRSSVLYRGSLQIGAKFLSLAMLSNQLGCGSDSQRRPEASSSDDERGRVGRGKYLSLSLKQSFPAASLDRSARRAPNRVRFDPYPVGEV